jgi:excisionase family DNA binding protein
VTDFLSGILFLLLQRSSAPEITGVPITKTSGSVPQRKELPEKLLTAQEVALYLDISKAKAYQLMQTGELRPVKFDRTTRVTLKELNRFVEERMSRAKYA